MSMIFSILELRKKTKSRTNSDSYTFIILVSSEGTHEFFIRAKIGTKFHFKHIRYIQLKVGVHFIFSL